MKADPKTKEMFEGMEKPKSLDEMISAYAQVAEKPGYGITADDIREVVELEEARRKAKTDKVVSDMEVLEDNDPEGVAGGKINKIKHINSIDGCELLQTIIDFLRSFFIRNI